mmetsp:Transcript_7196/g.16412  ORF Transcript_7196/g.16412 Transcript_7196/m.16412 type:complete len:221 (-) Transcript_7196:103-765(-)
MFLHRRKYSIRRVVLTATAVGMMSSQPPSRRRRVESASSPSFVCLDLPCSSASSHAPLEGVSFVSPTHLPRSAKVECGICPLGACAECSTGRVAPIRGSTYRSTARDRGKRNTRGIRHSGEPPYPQDQALWTRRRKMARWCRATRSRTFCCTSHTCVPPWKRVSSQTRSFRPRTGLTRRLHQHRSRGTCECHHVAGIRAGRRAGARASSPSHIGFHLCST